MGEDHWAVTVQRNGEDVVTIESNMLSGRDLDERDRIVIAIAAHHLLSFIGVASDPPGAEFEKIWDENVDNLYEP